MPRWVRGRLEMDERRASLLMMREEGFGAAGGGFLPWMLGATEDEGLGWLWPWEW